MLFNISNAIYQGLLSDTSDLHTAALFQMTNQNPKKKIDLFYLTLKGTYNSDLEWTW